MTVAAVRVGVRVRPLTNQEIQQGGSGVLLTRGPEIQLGERRFTYDAVFDAKVAQSDLYASVSKPLLTSFLDGYNATIMAYGQTSSGKTYTMGSEAHSELELSTSTGLIPRFMNHLFDELSKRKEMTDSTLLDFRLEASFLEVYGEDVHDLLDVQRKSLALREDASGGVVCAGLTHRTVNSAEEALQVLHEGTLNRTTAATLMNLTSSRSHAVFTVHLTQVQRMDDMDVSSTSRFTFVDLAGSERMKKTGAEGTRAKEGIKINEGLLALGNVINALADEEKIGKNVHVPYRQSKLTRLLQDALGGNSQTLFLACVSPSDTNASETLSTLHYANRARNIKNAPTQNVDASVLEVQRYKAMAQLYQNELIKAKFGSDQQSESPFGQVDAVLMERQDVRDYIEQLRSNVTGRVGEPRALSGVPFSQPAALTLTSPRAKNRHAPTGSPQDDNSPNKSILEHFDPGMLTEVNPDEDMAILNQLLELQHHEQEHDQALKEGDAEIKKVDGELAEQEALLLQLRDSLKIYHTMKTKYETLLAEVSQLETEKAQLAEQLEMASSDPKHGNSKAIKKELDKVEKSLARARNETRKHRDMYRKAEQEAQKCKVLERKITDLKQSRANLIRKQKEAAVRHREYTETKTREILALKRKDRNNEKRMSKLQNEVHMLKNNLDKRQALNEKLKKKVQQTEAHFMKLISMRQRDFKNRSKPKRGAADASPRSSRLADAEELNSVVFLLDRTVSERVEASERRYQYETQVSEYSHTMRQLVAAVESLKEARDATAAAHVIEELEHQVEDLELKSEVIGAKLEGLKDTMPSDEEDEATPEKDRLLSAIKAKDVSILRPLLTRMLNQLTDSESKAKRLSSELLRKELAFQSVESEVDSLHSRIATLSDELKRRERASTSVSNQESNDFALEALRKELDISTQHSSQLEVQVGALQSEVRSLEASLSTATEKLALIDVTERHLDHEALSAAALEESQVIWSRLGLPAATRLEAENKIRNCLDDTCQQILLDASSLKSDTVAEISAVQTELHRMTTSLGVDLVLPNSDAPLLEQLNDLRSKYSDVSESFGSAFQRALDIVAQWDALAVALFASQDDTADTCLRELKQFVQDESKSKPATSLLSASSLANCETIIKELRLKKSHALAENSTQQEHVFSLCDDMNLNDADVKSIVTKHLGSTLPDWWSDSMFDTVVRAVTTEGGVTRASDAFASHLLCVKESLESVASVRRCVSEMVQSLVQRAQETQLDIVGDETSTAHTSYKSFHELLFGLPPLSRERIEFCINAMTALVDSAEALTQTEIEALTVVWEALDVCSSDRSTFWSEINNKTAVIASPADSPFASVLSSSLATDVEPWLVAAAEQASGLFAELESRLYKLERVHTEVKELESRQDAKTKIFSLDQELRELNLRLAEFEDKKCNKQRLLTKKAGSSTLLKEERYRKQMQSQFAEKLEHLAKLVKVCSRDTNTFDTTMLSDEVRELLQNSDDSEKLVEKRTEFMHLRTTRVKPTPKRAPDRSNSPARKRKATDSAATRPMKSDALTKSNPSGLPPVPEAERPRKRRNTTTVEAETKKPKTSPPSRKPPLRPMRSNKRVDTNLKPLTRASKSRVPLSPAEKAESSSSSKASSKNKRLTLPPFGHVLEQATTPVKSNKENP